MLTPRRAACISLLIVLTTTSFTIGAKKEKEPSTTAPMGQQQRVLHALNRLTFGPRPGDVQRVAAIGIDKWIEQQLHPEKIDGSSLEARLAPLRTLRMDPRTLMENFPPPQLIKAVANGKLPLPSDPLKRAVYEEQLERYRERQQGNQEKSDAGAVNSSQASDAQKQDKRDERRLAEARAEGLVQMPPERFQQLLRSDEDRHALPDLPPADRERLVSGFTPQQRETTLALINPPMVVVSELQEAKLLRAVYSERQLQEVMTDFWFNHFNVFLGKGPERYLIGSYERDVIRPHALGKFQDLLVAVAKSPAMLVFLDNWQSVGPDSPFAKGVPGPRTWRRPGPRPGARVGVGCGPFGCYPRVGIGTRIPIGAPPAPRPRRGSPAQAKARQRGLNENYARELMELHTLGVDGGYRQKDVTEVARVFTGWTLKPPRQGWGFTFDERKHEPGTKYVLGHKIKEHGEDEGMKVLSILAHQPATARFISTELAQRFVSDKPPPALVARMAKTFLNSDGDIREVLRTMFHSPEFWSQDAYRAKVKTPLEFVVSAIRASGADVQNPMPLAYALNRMGMPLYGAQPPNGYSTNSEAWVNSAALLDRMNFALALAAGRLPGATLDQQQLIVSYRITGDRKVEAEPITADTRATLLSQLENTMLAGEVSKQTDETIRNELNKRGAMAYPVQVRLITGLILGSPEFQRR